MNNKYELFLAIQPGLEQILKDEILFRFSESLSITSEQIKATKGGVELNCPIDQVDFLIKNLKTPTKILMRIAEFKASDFPKLFQKCQQIPWTKYFKYPQYQINVSIKKSRLIHSDRVKETITKAIQKSYTGQEPSEKAKESLPTNFYYPLYIRLVDDQCSISLDISRTENGEEFFKRKLKKANSLASLRENLAFTLNLIVTKNIKENATLIDPMAGAGTILIESTDPINKQRHVFDHLRLGYPKRKKIAFNQIPQFNHFMANDIDKNHFNILKNNMENLSNCSLSNLDFKSMELNKDSNNYIVTNFPYGKRIKMDVPTLATTYVSWLKKQPFKRCVLLAPFQYQDHFKSLGFKIHSVFENGGLKVAIFTIKGLI